MGWGNARREREGTKERPGQKGEGPSEVEVKAGATWPDLRQPGPP